mmetsp:Transcript_33385/g.99439  ORF Transcript_33385/g.99439 Transcript_33385/m.99439 type:complete len:250 (-) Transcript_33385:72-821(-)
MTSTPSFGQGVLSQAKKLDRGLLGIPVVQTLVNAFVLRGNMDMASSQLAVTGHERASLERERQKAEDRMKELDSQISACKAVEAALQARAGPDASADLEASIARLETMESTSMEDWKAKGSAAIDDMQARAAALEEATTKDLEVIMQKITQAAEMVQGSEAYRSAVSKAQGAADMAQQRVAQVHGQLQEQLTAENLESVMAQARQAAGTGISQAQEMAGQLQDSEALKAARAKVEQGISSAAAHIPQSK